MKKLVVCCDGTWNQADQVQKDGQPCVTKWRTVKAAAAAPTSVRQTVSAMRNGRERATASTRASVC